MKLLSLLICSSFVLLSCQKELSHETPNSTGGTGGGTGGGGNSGYFMQAKINGTLRQFNYNNMAVYADLGNGATSLSLVGSATSNPSNFEGMNLAINFQGISPAVGTYSEEHSGTDYIAAGVYNPNSTTIVYGAGITYPSASPLEIKITKFDNSVVEGTFQGAFYKVDVTSGNPNSTEYLTFTEGSFRLPRR